MLAYALLPALLFSVPALAAPEAKLSVFEEADQAYEFGDCFAAINGFRRAVSRTSLTDEQKQKALFRSSYCYLEVGNAPAAEEGFGRYLKRFPADAEARMKYAQALYQNRKFAEARENAALIKEPSLLEEAWLLNALSSIEMGEESRAIDFLKSVESSAEMKPVFAYWLGVAYYKYGSLGKSRDAFQNAQKLAPATHWVRDSAQTWIDQLNGELKFLRGNFTLGYLWDSNIGQQSLVTVDANEDALSPAPSEKTYIKDVAYWVSTSLTALLFHGRKLQLYTTLDASSPFYQQSPAYNSQSLGASVAVQTKLASTLMAGATARYLDSRYNYHYVQDYLIFSPNITWFPTGRFYLRGDLSYTFYIRTNIGRIFSPRLNANYALADWISITGGASFVRARGQTAYYTSYYGIPYLAFGSQFSRYTSRGLNAGFTLSLPSEWTFIASAGRTWTEYEFENLAQTGGVRTYPNRGDKTWSFSGDLSHPLAKNLSLGGSLTYTINRSNGFQGTPSSNVRSDYNYDRLYTLISTTFSF